MAWEDELLQLQRIRRTWVRFAQELNPTGGWTGNPDRRYAKTHDSTGDLPNIGTVVEFGRFNNALANHEFTLEIPSIRTTLIDPINEWRELADRPSNRLLQRKLAYYLRQHDDNDDILDELIAIGQISSPSFPPGQASLNLNIPGGDFLGEDVGRRLLTTTDWPRALPEHLGRVIPFVYGHLSNANPTTIIIDVPDEEPEPEACATCTEGIAYTETFANAPATWETSGTWIATGQPGIGGGPDDPNYPYMYEAHACKIVPGGGPSGQNILSVDHTIPFNTLNSGILMADFHGFESTSLQDVAARSGTVSFQMRPSHTMLNSLTQSAGFYYSVVQWETISGAQIQWSVRRTAYSNPNMTHELRLLWREAGNVSHISSLFGQTLTAGEWHTYELSWQAGTYDAETCTTVATDGFIRLTKDGVVWHEVTGIPITMTPGRYCTSTLRFGLQRMLGDFCDIDFALEPEPGPEPPEEPPPFIVNEGQVECGETDGVNDQGSAGRGGWLEALLVDTGGGNPEISDYGTPAVASVAVLPQPVTAPALSASVQSGGSGATGGTFYYAAVSFLDGVMSELSNVVSASVSAGQKVHLTWPGSGDTVRVYRSTDPSFEAYDSYRVTGYPYATSDIPLSNGTVDDLYPGYDSRGDPPTPDGQDPHWDLTYRQTKYYYVSALFADGSESACSPAVSVGFFPRTAPLTVRFEWTAPAPGAVAVVGYRVRRASQNHHFEPGFDREWAFDTGTTQLDDPNNDTTAVTACATAPTGTGTTGQAQPTYALAGHWLKAINQVFVLKPDPESETNEFVWVLMTEGADYTQEVIERNGNRYHCLIFNEQQRSETCQYYKVSANVDGVETEADGTGELLTDADDIFEHIMLNVIFNTYHSSIGQYAPIGGKYFTDVEYSPGLFNRESVTAAKLVAQQRLLGGYVGAGAITEKTPARQLIWDLLVSYDLEFYQYRGSWYVKRFSPYINREDLPHFEPDTGVIRGTFEPSLLQDQQVNLIPFFAGPIGGGENEGYLISGELQDDQSIELYRRVIISEPIYLLWTQDPSTTNSVIRQYLARFKYPPINARLQGPVKWYALPPGSEVAVTHPDGLGPLGWMARVCRVLAVDLDLDDLTCWVTVRDVDNLVIG
jgi:hypothetical protein